MRETLPELLARRVSEGTIRPDPQQAAVAARLETLRIWLEEQAARKPGLLGRFAKAQMPPRGLYLWGGVGRGKSMLMDMFVEATFIDRKRRVHFHAFMQEVHRAMHLARQQGLDDPLAPFADAAVADLRLLAFDEMQISDITDAMIVGRLFERLMAGGVLIVTTSNRPPEDLYKNGLNRAAFLPFIELLTARMEVVELRSPDDYRQHRLAGEQVYFHPAGKAGTKMAAIWADLTSGTAPISLHLTVNGRDVELPRFANGVARASFWELCARPLGPADYLAIAQAVRVLILEDVPTLSSANYNEAKRFVTLIDALYEARVRLICSAADEPERLYIEGEGSFEFARTASRLREMQGAGWGRDRPAP
jgi:cell division protein ZapE